MKDHPTRAGLTIDTKAGPVWTGEVRPHWPALAQVLSWSRPRAIFWNAHGDLFHEAVPDELIDANMAAIALTPQHRHQLLTKRTPRMRAYFNGLDRAGGIGRVARLCRAMALIYEQTGHHRCKPEVGAPFVPHPLPNLWMGISAEDQCRFDERVADLLGILAAVRWVSGEPLLGPIDLRWTEVAVPKIDWLVVGGESGPGARPMHPDWARSLRDQCAAAGIAFLFKQWGEWAPAGPQYPEEMRGATDEQLSEWEQAVMEAPGISSGNVCCMTRDGDLPVDYRYSGEYQPPPGAGAWWLERIGKRAAGRLLDGVQHDGYPA